MATYSMHTGPQYPEFEDATLHVDVILLKVQV